MYPLTKKITLIGISGKAGSGKDTVAQYLHHHYKNVYIEHLADPLKACASAAFGIPEEHFYQRDIKEINNPYWEVSPRAIAQFIGTEMFRDTMTKLIGEEGKYFWVKRLAGKLNGELILDGEGEYEDGDVVVIPDVRFQTEADWIQSQGGVILNLIRQDVSQAVGISNHSSEAGFELIGRYGNIVNNTTFGDLYNSVDNLLTLVFNIKFQPK